MASEVKFCHFKTFSQFSNKKVSNTQNDDHYVYYTQDLKTNNIVPSAEFEGTPDIPYTAIVFIQDLSLFYTHGKITQVLSANNFVSFEEFSSMSTLASNAIQKGTIGTINGISLENTDNIEIDISLYQVVSELPTENISTNKIYIVPNATDGQTSNSFSEYIYVNDPENPYWDLLGTMTQKIDLSDYLKISDADKKYLTKSSNTTASIEISNTGSMSNFGDNGQAYLAVRAKGPKFIINTPYAGAAFGVKDDSTAAFSHKTYSQYNKDTATYTGAKNTAVLQFAGPVGLRYAKNTGNTNDVTEDMYKYVGVINSPDEFQRVYSAKQVDELLKTMADTISSLEQRIQELESELHRN